ncbi:MAG: acyloxyacyl hydrolase [Candidatus Omnitrophota bacterium]|nr:acyloxyacyl hydrolase [Candidatus Omnitrophota bacterium]
MKKIITLVLISGFILLASNTPHAEETNQKSLVGVEFLTGFGWGKLKGQTNYNVIPFSAAFDFNLKNLSSKINFNPSGIFQFQIEPFLGFISRPHNNLETGTIFWLKLGLFPDTWRLEPYVKLGAGLNYMTLHTDEQSTQFNFTEQAALGIHYFFTNNTAFTLEGRWRHLSNSGIKEPNHGINSYSVNTGIAYKF